MSIALAIILILGTALGTAHGVLVNKENERRKLADQFAEDFKEAQAEATIAAEQDASPSVVLEGGSEEVKQLILAEGRKFYGQ